VRITGGSARGQIIIGPKGSHVRPSASKLRQAFFNIIGNKIENVAFLDLCAGTGLMGLEALSRGAKHLTAIEHHRPTAKTLELNIEKLGFEKETEIIIADVCKYLPKLREASFDIIYTDPPYKTQIGQIVLQILGKKSILKLNGILAIEHLSNQEMPEHQDLLFKHDTRKYGQSSISFYGYNHN
jgi:16S rRNA (guanine(966)-N(2))-methyltransferase RsmD